jgi:hypothetical protein
MSNVAATARSMHDIDATELLGFLEFHGFGDLKIHKDELGKLFEKNMLPMSYLPNKIHPADAYRRATAQAQSTIEIDHNGNRHKARLLVREVKSDSNMIIRHLVREIVNAQDERLEYDEVGRFVLDRKNNNVLNTSIMHSFSHEYPYADLMRQIQALYVEWSEYHTKDTVNNIVRRIIKDMNNVNLTPNGRATFIPKTQKNLLMGLQGLFEDLIPYQADGCESYIEIIPVIDTVEQRRTVEKRVEREITSEANELLADFANLLGQDQRPSVRIVKSYAKRVVELQEKLTEYEKLIHCKMTVIQDQLNDTLTRMRKTERELTENAG